VINLRLKITLNFEGSVLALLIKHCAGEYACIHL
jgi:hypothetical protein